MFFRRSVISLLQPRQATKVLSFIPALKFHSTKNSPLVVPHNQRQVDQHCYSLTNTPTATPEHTHATATLATAMSEQKQRKKEDIVLIVGPTAVGKSKLAIDLCKHLNGEVISCDSIQVYKGLDIGSAKVTTAEADVSIGSHNRCRGG